MMMRRRSRIKWMEESVMLSYLSFGLEVFCFLGGSVRKDRFRRESLRCSLSTLSKLAPALFLDFSK